MPRHEEQDGQKKNSGNNRFAQFFQAAYDQANQEFYDQQDKKLLSETINHLKDYQIKINNHEEKINNIKKMLDGSNISSQSREKALKRLETLESNLEGYKTRLEKIIESQPELKEYAAYQALNMAL